MKYVLLLLYKSTSWCTRRLICLNEKKKKNYDHWQKYMEKIKSKCINIGKYSVRCKTAIGTKRNEYSYSGLLKTTQTSIHTSQQR